MKPKFAAFIILAAASFLTSAVVVPGDAAQIFELAAETAELTTAPATATDSFEFDAGLSAAFRHHHRCYWSGTAPLCLGYCGHQYIEIRRNKCGDGACCWAGSKALCCRRRRRMIYPPEPMPHHPRGLNSSDSPSPPLHSMLPSKEHALSRYSGQGIEEEVLDEARLNATENADFEFDEFDYLEGSEGLSAFDESNDFNGSHEYQSEEFQDGKEDLTLSEQYVKPEI